MGQVSNLGKPKPTVLQTVGDNAVTWVNVGASCYLGTQSVWSSDGSARCLCLMQLNGMDQQDLGTIPAYRPDRATDRMLIFSERHAGLGVCAWKAHGSCGLVHAVYKDRKCSCLFGV